jgi:hypothetical protein
MRNVDSCRRWRCMLCPCNVRHTLFIHFWNRTILLCMPCIYVLFIILLVYLHRDEVRVYSFSGSPFATQASVLYNCWRSIVYQTKQHHIPEDCNILKRINFLGTVWLESRIILKWAFKIRYAYVGWINLSKKNTQWSAGSKTVVKFRVPKEGGEFCGQLREC